MGYTLYLQHVSENAMILRSYSLHKGIHLYNEILSLVIHAGYEGSGIAEKYKLKGYINFFCSDGWVVLISFLTVSYFL